MEFVLTGLYPGVSVADAKARTDWDLQVSPGLAGIPGPAAAELAALRGAQGRRASRGDISGQ